MSIIGTVIRFFTERSAKRKDLDQLIAELNSGKNDVLANIDKGSDTPKHREVMRHIIAIERWGQQRLRTLQGQPYVRDENEAYAPAADLDLPHLRTAFVATRDETVALAEQLNAANVTKTQTAPHNDMGDLTLGGWLVYLKGHATFESRSIK